MHQCRLPKAVITLSTLLRCAWNCFMVQSICMTRTCSAREYRATTHVHRRMTGCQHDTDLIYTFSAYNDGRDLLVHLQEELIAHGFELKRRPSKEVFEKIVSTEENKYISRLVKFVCTFIQNFKTNDFVIDDFARFRTSSSNERTKLFLTICEQCYLEYSKRLKEYHAIDFEDMINDSARILREEEVQGKKLDFKYIIVDEYQDISRQRFNQIGRAHV